MIITMWRSGSKEELQTPEVDADAAAVSPDNQLPGGINQSSRCDHGDVKEDNKECSSADVTKQPFDLNCNHDADYNDDDNNDDNDDDDVVDVFARQQQQPTESNNNDSDYNKRRHHSSPAAVASAFTTAATESGSGRTNNVEEKQKLVCQEKLVCHVCNFQSETSLKLHVHLKMWHDIEWRPRESSTRESSSTRMYPCCSKDEVTGRIRCVMRQHRGSSRTLSARRRQKRAAELLLQLQLQHPPPPPSCCSPAKVKDGDDVCVFAATETASDSVNDFVEDQCIIQRHYSTSMSSRRRLIAELLHLDEQPSGFYSIVNDDDVSVFSASASDGEDDNDGSLNNFEDEQCIILRHYSRSMSSRRRQVAELLHLQQPPPPLPSGCSSSTNVKDGGDVSVFAATEIASDGDDGEDDNGGSVNDFEDEQCAVVRHYSRSFSARRRRLSEFFKLAVHPSGSSSTTTNGSVKGKAATKETFAETVTGNDASDCDNEDVSETDLLQESISDTDILQEDVFETDIFQYISETDVTRGNIFETKGASAEVKECDKRDKVKKYSQIWFDHTFRKPSCMPSCHMMPTICEKGDIQGFQHCKEEEEEKKEETYEDKELENKEETFNERGEAKDEETTEYDVIGQREPGNETITVVNIDDHQQRPTTTITPETSPTAGDHQQIWTTLDVTNLEADITGVDMDISGCKEDAYSLVDISDILSRHVELHKCDSQCDTDDDNINNRNKLMTNEAGKQKSCFSTFLDRLAVTAIVAGAMCVLAVPVIFGYAFQ